MLELIDLDIESLGYRKFISAWLYKGSSGAFLVDPGPACTVEKLFSALDKSGVDSLDWILLTHIHLDHAGGTGLVSRHFPEAGIVCHERAVSHLIDPSRLWEGSRKVLGRTAEIYGPVEPVPQGRILTADQVSFEDGIKVIPTPGHAPHHQSYVFRDLLFSGEVFGVFLELEGGDFYLRPATPPRFVFRQFSDSIERLAPQTDKKICFGHYGMCEHGRRVPEVAESQLRLWLEVVRSHRQNPNFGAITADLKANDPVFARVDELSPDIREREMYYTANSIRGMLGYIEKNA